MEHNNEAYFSPIYNTGREGRGEEEEYGAVSIPNWKHPPANSSQSSASSKCCMGFKVFISQLTSSKRTILVIILLFSLVWLCVGSEIVLRYWERQSRKYLHEGDCQSFNCSVTIDVEKLKEVCCCDVLFISPQQDDMNWLRTTSLKNNKNDPKNIIEEPSPGVVWNDTPHRICGSDNGIKMNHCNLKPNQPQHPCWYDIIDHIVWREYPSGYTFRVIIIVALVLITAAGIALILRGCKPVPIRHLSFDAQAYLRRERFEKMFAGDDDDDDNDAFVYHYMNTVRSSEVSVVATMNSSDAEYSFPNNADDDDDDDDDGGHDQQTTVSDHILPNMISLENNNIDDDAEDEQGYGEESNSTRQQYKLGYDEHGYEVAHPITMICESPPSEGDD